MKVLYDISTLGRGHHYLQDRTGIYRAVENVGRGLATSPECEVSFCATESSLAVTGSVSYVKTRAPFKGRPLLCPRGAGLKAALERRLSAVEAELDGSPFFKPGGRGALSALTGELKLRKRVERRSLAYVCRIFGKELNRLDTKWLTQVDIFHSPVYPLAPKVGSAQRFLTVYDLIPILYPQFCEPEQIQFINSVLQSITPDDWVLCDSQSTRDDLCNHIPIDPARVFVTHLAAAPELFYPCTDAGKLATTRERYRIPNGPYLLSLNTLEPRKNIEQVVRCFARLAREERAGDLSLVLVGLRGWLADNLFETIAGYDSLKDRIVMTGYVADEDLAALYSGALAFVYPSFYEGFGLPPLEAMQCGVPVVTSNTSSLPEVVGDAGVTVDPADSDGLCEAVLNIYRSRSLRESMSRKSLERAGQFSWEKCVAETIAAYKTALAA